MLLYLSRIKINTPFYQGHYGTVVDYEHQTDIKDGTTTLHYHVRIDNAHSDALLKFSPEEIEPV